MPQNPNNNKCLTLQEARMSKSKAVSCFLCLLLTSLSISLPVYSATKDITVGAIYLDTQGYYAGVRQGVQDAAKAPMRKFS